jgi:hypothetical protein
MLKNKKEVKKLYLKKSPEQIQQDWQKFLEYNSQSLKLSKHCQAQLKKRLPDFYKTYSNTEIIDMIKLGNPTFELFVRNKLRIEIEAKDVTFIVDLRTGEIVTVLSPEMEHGIDNLASIKYCNQRKLRRKNRRFKRKVRFII